jgi:hypothetical protein
MAHVCAYFPGGAACRAELQFAARIARAGGGLGSEIRNPNIEIRDKFKYQMAETGENGPVARRFGTFEFRSFELVSDFEIRASSLSQASYSLRMGRAQRLTVAMPASA